MNACRYAWLLALPAVSILLNGCGGGGGGSTKPTNADGFHEPSPDPGDAILYTGSGVLVGVADTGFRLTHETIAPYRVKEKNLIDDTNNVSGDEDHGTAVASVITQAPSSTSLLLAKVAEPTTLGLAYTNVLDYSVGYLATEGARVINHSWSGRLNLPDPSASYRGINSLASLKKIVTSNGGLGSVYVVAAGNEGQTLQPDNPIHQESDLFKRLLIVGGSSRDNNDQVIETSQSNHPGDNTKWQSRFLTAPWRVEAATAVGDDTYGIWSGTSFSAPRVAEFAAAIIELWPHLDAVTVSQHLLETAEKSSPLYQQNSCGEDGSANCGYFYLGQGEADILEALAPAGALALPSGNQVSGTSVDAQQSIAQFSGAYGDSLASSGALANVAAFDDLGRDYRIDLSGHSQSQNDHAQKTRNRMARLSAVSPQSRYHVEGDVGAFSVRSTLDGHGETLTSRLDAQLGASQWTAFHYAGDETDPLSAYRQSGMMPLLAYQGGSVLSEHLETVNGLRSMIALDDQIALVAKHWTGDGHADTTGMPHAYQADRTDLGLRLTLNDDIGLTSTVGVLNETQGLLGAQGSGALSLGERNQMTFTSLALDANLGEQLNAFAHYDHGNGDAQGKGLIQRIDGIQTSEVGLGLQWSGDRHLAALGYRQPMRIESAEAFLSVPVGRTLEGTVIREIREASLSPSGRQQDIELGYTFLPSERSALQVNLIHTLEPGHDRNTSPDTATMVNYRVQF